jgi:hypothetical protein
MNRSTFLFSAVLFCLAAPSPAPAQNALQSAFNHCLDESRGPDEQIKSCMLVVNAQGLEPDEIAFAYIDLGIIYANKGNDDQALSALNRALTLQPNAWQGLVNRAFLFLRRGNIDPALADYDRAAASDPAQVKMFRQEIAMDYRTVKPGTTTDEASDEREKAQHDQAIAQLKDALTRTFAYRCRMRAQAGQVFDSALADCNSALRLSPQFAPALALRGFVEIKLGNIAAGNADIAAARQLDPKLGDDPAAWMGTP